MEEKEINELIEKKLSEAKLDISEKRLNYLIIIAGGFLTLFGIIVPLWQTNSSTERVDRAIQEMKSDLTHITELANIQVEQLKRDISKSLSEINSNFNKIDIERQNLLKETENKVSLKLIDYENKFNQLTNEAYRKPQLVCLFDEKEITAQTLVFDDKSREILLKLKNNGDATARKIKILLYLKTEHFFEVFGDFSRRNYSDDEYYQESYEVSHGAFSLDPEESTIIRFIIVEEKINENTPALLKIYYEQPEPVKYFFNISINYK